MRVHQPHQRLVAVVGNADDADLAVAAGHVFDEPVDGVVDVGGVVHFAGRGRAMQGRRMGHDELAAGTVFSAHVHDRADVFVLHDDVGRVVVALQGDGQAAAGLAVLAVAGQGLGVVGRHGQHDAGLVDALGDQDHAVQFHSVAHRNL